MNNLYRSRRYGLRCFSCHGSDFILIFAIPVLPSSVHLCVNGRLQRFQIIRRFQQLHHGFKDSSFRSGLIHTLTWILLQGTLHVALGTVVALLLADRPRGWKFIRTSYMIPNMISGSAFAIILVNLFNPQIGFINSAIRKLGFSEFSHNWYFNPVTAFPTVTITWLLFAGLITILVLAEIMSIPKALYESAELEGATKFQQRYISHCHC